LPTSIRPAITPRTSTFNLRFNENDTQLGPATTDVEGLPERPDGNDVNIDRESLVLSQTQLQYQMGVQLIKEEFHRLLTAIKDGN
jgi:flagellar basal-body rod protein FlgB